MWVTWHGVSRAASRRAAHWAQPAPTAGADQPESTLQRQQAPFGRGVQCNVHTAGADHSHARPVEDEVQPKKDAAGGGEIDTAYQTLLTRKCASACLDHLDPAAGCSLVCVCRRWHSKCDATAQASAPHKAALAEWHAAQGWGTRFSCMPRNTPWLQLNAARPAPTQNAAEPIRMNGVNDIAPPKVDAEPCAHSHGVPHHQVADHVQHLDPAGKAARQGWVSS